jgi:phosphoribosylanthranilate isomerase
VTKIKICGLTSARDAVIACEAGADFLGLVFAKSKRQVSPERALQIVETLYGLKQHPMIVGVFVNISAIEVNHITRYCHLDLVQLSGDETWSYCQKIEFPLIKVIHIGASKKASEVLCEIEKGYKTDLKHKPIYLLDTKTKGIYGGTGITFDWKIAKEISSRYPVIIAGGLSQQNVENLIKQLNPFGIDVSSGVESCGKKDKKKIDAFIKAVRRAGKEVGSGTG